MRSFLGIILAILLVHNLAVAQTNFPSYYSFGTMTAASPGAFRFGLYGLDNPATLASLHQPDFYTAWSDGKLSRGVNEHWMIAGAVPNFGFAVSHTRTLTGQIYDYQVSLAAISGDLSSGFGYGWSSGDVDILGRTGRIHLGSLFRPNRFLSIGLSGILATSGSDKQAMIELAVRPFGNEWITLFGDYATCNWTTSGISSWSSGAVIEPLAGVRLIGRYYETKEISIGVNLSLGNLGIGTQANLDKNRGHLSNTYSVRVGAYDRNIPATYFAKNSHYVELSVQGPFTYQRFKFFDQGITLKEMLEMIDAAKKDPSIGGIAINTTQLDLDRELSWEIREKLIDFKLSGKKIVMFLDRGGLELYHFASVADKIVMDPTGLLTFEGYIMGRTFLKGTLEKLGIGYDEWRFFKYKSAMEALSRDKMSDADREQRQRLVDEFYAITKADICSTKRLTEEQYETLVNNEFILRAPQLVERGLIDTLGRWETVKEVIKQMEGEEKSLVKPRSLTSYNEPKDNRWGKKPKIAVIYAIGACDMDEGIAARRLVKFVQSAVDDAAVKAIVLRVDSPGGDAMASDYIAEALRKAKGKKPIIVSQGNVAASGGYWLSMYADTIVAAPGTITGSIGVIGGWVYNKGLKESIGITTDHVKTGSHADLGFGFVLPIPFISVGLPDRGLSPEEHQIMENMIRDFYKDFVSKVADGRKKTFGEIDSIGQGRVWSGRDGKEKGLVDIIGGLEKAILIAQEKAGLSTEESIELVEMPEKGLFNPSAFVPRLIGVEIAPDDTKLVRLMKFFVRHNGVPMPVIPLELIAPNMPW